MRSPGSRGLRRCCRSRCRRRRRVVLVCVAQREHGVDDAPRQDHGDRADRHQRGPFSSDGRRPKGRSRSPHPPGSRCWRSPGSATSRYGCCPRASPRSRVSSAVKRPTVSHTDPTSAAAAASHPLSTAKGHGRRSARRSRPRCSRHGDDDESLEADAVRRSITVSTLLPPDESCGPHSSASRLIEAPDRRARSGRLVSERR